MKMGFLLKNNARKGMGRERSAQKGRGSGALKKGEEKECSKKGEEKECSKRERKRRQKKGLQNSRILKRMAGWAEIRKF